MRIIWLCVNLAVSSRSAAECVNFIQQYILPTLGLHKKTPRAEERILDEY